jgi:site-specific DNA recombinase
MKQYDLQKIQVSSPEWHVGAYIRLSKEDDDKKDESNSVTNQRSIINDYLKNKSEFSIYDFYCDDGFTGTDFNRPEFQRMVRDIKSKKINSVVVKDFSRLGRDYIGTGEYLEKIFPLYGIRFIAIDDHMDTLKKTNIDMAPFKAVFNDMYAADISKKVRSAKETMAKNGKFTGGFAPYGYKKHPDNRHKLIIDENVSEVIKKIFQSYIDGLGIHTIAAKLNKEGIMSPAEYKISEGFNYGFDKKNEKKTIWTSTQIRRILLNEVYLGNLVQHKSTRISYKIKSKKEREIGEYIIIENAHEPIISIDTWEKVRKLLKTPTRKLKNEDKVHTFAGIIKCGSCGRIYKRKYATSGDKNKTRLYYLECSTVRQIGSDGCSNNKSIREDFMFELVLNDVKKEIYFGLMASEISEIINAKYDSLKRRKNIFTNIQMLEEKQQKVYKLKKEMYQDYKEGLLSKEDYMKYKLEYDEEEKTLNEKIELARNERNEENFKIDIHNVWISKIKKYSNVQEVADITRDLIIELIDSIYVYNDKRIKIVYKHRSEFMEILDKILMTQDCTNISANWLPDTEVQFDRDKYFSILQEILDRFNNEKMIG